MVMAGINPPRFRFARAFEAAFPAELDRPAIGEEHMLMQ
jgi:hypothetical protein